MRQPHLYQQLYLLLQDRIVRGEIAVGETLPTILQIAEMYGVGVNTVHTAFKLLEDDGYIKPIKRKGTVVLSGSVPQGKWETYLSERREAYINVCGLIEYMLPEITQAAVSRLTEDDFLKMERACAAGEKVNDPSALLERWENFYHFLAAPLKNEIYNSIITSIGRFLMHPMFYFSRLDVLPLKHYYVVTTELIDAARAGEFENISKIMRRLTNMVTTRIKECLDTLPPAERQMDFYWDIHKSSRFLYAHISSSLMQEIILGRYPCGAFLPSQSALQSTFHASVASVRTALNQLVQAGIAKYVPGRGYLVEPNRAEENLLPEKEGAYITQIFWLIGHTYRSFSKDALPLVPQEAINAFYRANKLCGTPEGYFYAPVISLISLWSEYHPNACVRNIFSSLEAEMTRIICLSSYCFDCPQDVKRSVGQAVLEAVKALEEKAFEKCQDLSLKAIRMAVGNCPKIRPAVTRE